MVVKRVLHLSRDDKFTDIGIRSFEKVLPNCNDLYIYTQKPLKYIKSKNTIINNKKEISLKILKTQFDCVVIHALDECWFKLIKEMPVNIPVIWIGWGYDYYDLLEFEGMLPKTKEIYEVLNKKEYFKSIFDGWKKIRKNKIKKDIIERINYFCPVLPDEYEIIKSSRNWSKFPQYIKFNYGSLEVDYLKGFMDGEIEGNNILVGNSAAPTNNHYEVFSLLSGIDFLSGKVMVPLSYGNDKYKKNIIGHGRYLFKENFEPLDVFMSINDYIKIIKSCKLVLMGHIRQQALGNIIIMIYLGAKVFLNPENPIYSYLKSQGIVVFNIYDFDQNELNGRLSDDEVALNRLILSKYWSEMENVNRVKLLVKTVFGNF
ncbi:TDP-N-acetylfucosamine:lipid II N-acetylfucosaminyltransferase [Acinetobacter indicus]|uniref:TDP-N-acetylfucosamine:lipid II N-acetylfucosaminyltransferase n=1 Tax=Acinetobacter indicus TaxID=756892 RepID=UPI0014447990|nr:TDP-N-acetylfucosamine:lipid II N-acetylfucosaminyltransferase [Acinetobacter indicus]